MKDEADTEQKKKRGRKKKIKEVIEAPVEKFKSRRGRKAKTVINAYSTEETIPVSLEDENVIVKLNIKKDTSCDSMLPSCPNAYNTHEDNTFQSIPMEYSDKPSENPEEDEPSINKELKVVELLKDFEMKSKSSEWPTTTNICCYWCCHQFKNPPFGIPVKYINGKFHVYGCFCSLECASAYNFDSNNSSDEKWERYNLINLLSREIGHKRKVKIAPDRLTLKMFGGYMDIEEFRKFAETSKVLNINFPPMMTLTQQIEELNECDVSSEYKYIPLDIERINKYKEKLTLRRSKPVKDFKNTLDSMMNLKIN